MPARSPEFPAGNSWAPFAISSAERSGAEMHLPEVRARFNNALDFIPLKNIGHLFALNYQSILRKYIFRCMNEEHINASVFFSRSKARTFHWSEWDELNTSCANCSSLNLSYSIRNRRCLRSASRRNDFQIGRCSTAAKLPQKIIACRARVNATFIMVCVRGFSNIFPLIAVTIMMSRSSPCRQSNELTLYSFTSSLYDNGETK